MGKPLPHTKKRSFEKERGEVFDNKHKNRFYRFYTRTGSLCGEGVFDNKHKNRFYFFKEF